MPDRIFTGTCTGLQLQPTLVAAVIQLPDNAGTIVLRVSPDRVDAPNTGFMRHLFEYGGEYEVTITKK